MKTYLITSLFALTPIALSAQESLKPVAEKTVEAPPAAEVAPQEATTPSPATPSEPVQAGRAITSMFYIPTPGQSYLNTFVIMSGNTYLEETSNSPAAGQSKTLKYSVGEATIGVGYLYGLSERFNFGAQVGFAANGTENTEYSDSAGNDPTNRKESKMSNSGLLDPTIKANYRIATQESCDYDVDVRMAATPKTQAAKRSKSYDDNGDGIHDSAAKGNVASNATSYLLSIRAGKRVSEKIETALSVGWRFVDAGEFSYLKSNSDRSDIVVKADPYSVYLVDFDLQVDVTKEVYGIAGLGAYFYPETKLRFGSGTNNYEYKSDKFGQVAMTVGAKYKASEKSVVSATITGRTQGEYETQSFNNGVKSTSIVKNKSNFTSIVNLNAEFWF